MRKNLLVSRLYQSRQGCFDEAISFIFQYLSVFLTTCKDRAILILADMEEYMKDPPENLIKKNQKHLLTPTFVKY